LENKRPTPTTARRLETERTNPPERTVSPALDELSSLCAELWREVDFDRLVNRFVEQLNRRIAPTRAALYNYGRDNAGKLQLTPAQTKFRRERQLTKDQQEIGMARLQSAFAGGFEISDGINQLTVDGEHFAFLLLGDAETHRALLLLRMETSPGGYTEANAAMVDFLSRQLQYASVWASRLVSTQSQLYRDDLTGLYNMRYMDEVLEKEVRRAIRFGTRFCVFFVDLDNLKEVNDRHGHLTGSSVLKQFADILRIQLREVDSIIRYGGDEYIVLLLGANAEVGAAVAERLRKSIADHPFVTAAGCTIHLTCSIGVAAFPEHGKTKDELLRVADQSMYRGKRSGKNQVIIAGHEPDSIAAKTKRDEK
jgi:diguanylate cyclase (GGDEF)-like protein